MTTDRVVTAPVHGLIDRDGRLIEAEPRLAMLNAAAGGALGQPLAVPQIATLARLAQRLGILVSRSIIAADGEDDLDLWVRAQPDAAGIRLAITGWQIRPRWGSPSAEPERRADFLHAASDWRWECDASLRLTFLSIAAGERYGFDAAVLLGKPLTRLFALDEGEDGDLPLLDAVAERRGFDGQPAVLRPTGRPLLLAATPRLDASGAFAGYAGGVRMVEDAAAPAMPQAEPDGVPDAFTARLDTALRLPLGRIISTADSINAQIDGPLKQDYVDYAADIATAGRHLLGLVDDLVDLSAIERPDFHVEAERIDLADLARRAGGLLQVRAAEAKVRIDRPANDESLPASGEFRRALQVLVNLVGNAVRYSPPEGMVWIRAEREGGIAAVIVADQGRGIALADQGRIFEKFERVDASEPGGTGLGLYIARRLARAMGGDVTVDSAPGQGARFVFTLPYREG